MASSTADKPAADKPRRPPAMQPSAAAPGRHTPSRPPERPRSSSACPPDPVPMMTTPDRAMAVRTPPTLKKPLDISSLMSPPEPLPLESFPQSHATSEMRRQPGPNPPLSPPISPHAKAHDHIVVADAAAASAPSPVPDPILYPAEGGSPRQHHHPPPPLFSRPEPADPRRIVDDHVVARPRALFRRGTTPPPLREDYELMLYFKSQVMKKYKENPKGWLRRERALLVADRRAGARHHHHHFRLHPLLPATKAAPPLRSQAQRVAKQQQHPRKASRPTPQGQAARSARTNHARAPPPPPPPQPAIRRISATPDPGARRVVAPNREDKDFEALPDYCPPAESLPARANALKVDWKGTPIDLGGDPHRDRLHADELALAANLRLDCATYLTSKRRMFMRRLDCVRVGKEFRKTDAQQACKIDVNKASKLWTAFERVGWLDKRWVLRFL